jgi:hypothetical protein
VQRRPSRAEEVHAAQLLPLDTISLPCGSLERDVRRPPAASPPAAASPDLGSMGMSAVNRALSG